MLRRIGAARLMLSVWLFLAMIISVGGAPKGEKLGRSLAEIEPYGELPDFDDWPTLEEVAVNPVQEMGVDPASMQEIEKQHGSHAWVPNDISRRLLSRDPWSKRGRHRLMKRYYTCVFANTTYYTSVNNSVFQVYCGCTSSGSSITSNTYCNASNGGNCFYYAVNLQQCIDTCSGNYTNTGCRSVEYGSTSTTGRSCYAKGAGSPMCSSGPNSNAAFYVGQVNASFMPTNSYPSTAPNTYSPSSSSSSSSSTASSQSVTTTSGSSTTSLSGSGTISSTTTTTSS